MVLDQYSIWMAALAVGYMGLIVPALRRRQQAWVRALLIAYLLTSVVWTWAVVLIAREMLSTPMADPIYVIGVYGQIVLPAIMYILTVVFIGGAGSMAWVWAGLGAALFVCAGVLHGLNVEWPWWREIATLPLYLSVAGLDWLFLSSVASLICWRAFRATPSPLHRNRLRYWVLALMFVFIGSGLLLALPLPYSSLGSLLHWLGAALATLALVSHTLPDISGLVRRSLRYVSVTLSTAAIFFGCMLLVARWNGYGPGSLLWMAIPAAVAVVLAVLYPPVRRGIQFVLTRVLFGRGYDRERVVREYAERISNILDLDKLVEVSIGLIDRALRIERGALLVWEEAQCELRPVSGLGAVEADPIVLDPESDPLAYILETKGPLSQYDLDLLPRFQSMPDQVDTWFRDLNSEIYVPILAEDGLLGILSLGHKTSGEPYSPGDVTLLHTLAGQTAVALKNARLVEDLVRLNAEITLLNQELRDTNERLALLDKTKSDFISIASHELKTPLTHIKGYTDMLREVGGQSSSSGLNIGRIAAGLSKGTDRLTSVVEAMLDVSLIEQEAFTVHPVLTSVRYVVEQVIGGLEGALGERRLELETSGLDGLPQIMADETRLHQALRNVVINSVKFTPDGGQIEIAGQMAEDGDAIELAIADTGIGIDPEHQELIFEKFYRVGDLNLHSTGVTKFKGAGPGLGLPIARGIIEAHGGQIWVESSGSDEEGCPGSTFYVRLPVKGPEAQLAAEH